MRTKAPNRRKEVIGEEGDGIAIIGRKSNSVAWGVLSKTEEDHPSDDDNTYA